MKTIGIILIALGIIMMIYTGFNVVTEEKVVDLGSVEISKEENHPVQWSPILGGVFILAGVVALVMNKGKA